jgi:hypothetical protein
MSNVRGANRERRGEEWRKEWGKRHRVYQYESICMAF